MAAYSCTKVVLIAQKSQNIGKVGLGQGSYLGYSVFKKIGKLDQLLSSSYPVVQKFRRNRSI